MQRFPFPEADRDQRGLSLVELLVALVVLSVGVLAVAQLFPAGSRSMQSSRMLTTANFLAQQKIEELSALEWTDPALSVGRHPAVSSEAFGSSGQWQRFYRVELLPAPLDNLKRISVNVSWTHVGDRFLTDTLYLRQ